MNILLPGFAISNFLIAAGFYLEVGIVDTLLVLGVLGIFETLIIYMEKCK